MRQAIAGMLWSKRFLEESKQAVFKQGARGPGREKRGGMS
jgi:hypothetical protein